MAKNNNQTLTSVFLWRGRNTHGKQLKGELTASNSETVKTLLRRQGIIPSKVRKKPKDIFTPRKVAITPADIAVFSRMIATMMSAGIPLMQSLQIIGEGNENPSMKALILSIKEDVE